jgi:hypothetical protein
LYSVRDIVRVIVSFTTLHYHVLALFVDSQFSQLCSSYADTKWRIALTENQVKHCHVELQGDAGNWTGKKKSSTKKVPTKLQLAGG